MRLLHRFFPLLPLLSLQLAALSVASPAARATSFIEQPFADAVKNAPVIVRGKAGASHGDWGATSDGSKRIYTYTELSVDETLKGAVDSHAILIRELGGEVGGVGMQVSGTAHFNRGEDIVVMLGERNSDGSYDVWGMMMAKLDVQRDADGNENLSGPAINNLTHPVVGSDGDEGQRDTRGAPKWTLYGLRKLIQSQGDRPSPLAKSPQVQAIASKPAATPAPSPAASPTAPGLHSSVPEDAASAGDSQGYPIWLWIGLALSVGILVAVGLLKARRRNGRNQ